MSESRFNPSEHRGKDIVYVRVPNTHCICSVWEWNNEKNRYERRPSGLRYYAYKKAGGRQRARCFESFERAKAWRDTDTDAFDKRENQEMLFSELKEKYFAQLQKKIKPSTIETYESNTRHLRFFCEMPASQIFPKTIDAWLQTVKQPEYLKLQHRTRLSYEHELQVLRNILTYYSEYICDSYQLPFKKRHLQDCIIDPVRYKERKANQQFRFMPQEDCERFLHELKKRAEKEQKYFIYYLLGLLQLRTGIRVGEACALDFSDIQWATNQIRIKKTVHWSRKKGVQTRVFPMTKSGKPRWVFISEELAQALSKWGQIIERSVGLIFSFDGFKPVCYRSVQYHYNTAFKLAEVDWSSTHILRHSFATDFLEKTQNPHALKELMGHSALKQTEHYSKVTEKLIERGALEYQKQLEQAGKVIRIH